MAAIPIFLPTSLYLTGGTSYRKGIRAREYIVAGYREAVVARHVTKELRRVATVVRERRQPERATNRPRPP